MEILTGVADQRGARRPSWVGGCGQAARVNLGFRASLVGAAGYDGAAPIARICGDRLFSPPAAIAGVPPLVL